jgi:integrase
MKRIRGESNRGRKFPAEIMTAAEIRAMLAATTAGPLGARNRAIIFLFWRCALRIGELLALKESDVGPDFVRVLRGKGAKPRTVGLDAEASAAVREWVAERRRLKIAGPLICKLDGDPVGPNAVRELLVRLKTKSGLAKRCNPHSFRATWASTAARQIPIADVMESLGHSDLAVTTRYISRVGGAAIDSARRIVWD